MKRCITMLIAMLSLVGLLALNTGCAFGNRSIALTYEPITSSRSSSAETVAVSDFDDVRDDKEIVGEIRNGMGFKTADVLAKDQSAGAWLASALAEELTVAGFVVNKVQDSASSREAILISGSVSEVNFTMSISLKGTVRVSIQVAKHHVPVLNKQYVGEASLINWAATIRSQEAVLREALQDLLKQAVPEIIQAIQE